MAWLSGWSYRKEISITGQSGAGTDYQVLFDIGDSAGGDFHLEGNCTNFPEDIEVTDNDGETLLKFWIPDKTADPLEMRVKVADDLGTNKTIYIYYRKSGATTESDIGATFLFGDDFNDASIDTAKWDVTANVVESGGLLTITGQGAYRSAISDDTFGTNTAIRTRTNIGLGGYGNNQDLGYGAGNPRKHGFTTDYPTANTYFTRYDESTRTDIGTGYTGYHIWDVIRNDTTSTIYKIDGSTVDTKGSSGAIAYNVGFSAYANGITVVSDWFLLRKYNSPEPAFSSAGSEETPPVTGNPYWYYQMLKRRN